MNNYFVAISLICLGFLSACASHEPVTPAPVVVAPAPTALRAGNGRVESITTVASAAAGATGSAASSVQRVAVRMDDGTVQVVDTRATGLALGDRVELTRDGMIRH
jgi:hypothetical protein